MVKHNQIKLIDLEAQQNKIRQKIENNIKAVLNHGSYINGPEIKALENKLADYVGVRFAVACSSGTDALLMSLMVYDVGPGDAVFVPSFTFVATASTVSLLQATPVFVDIEPHTFNMCPRSLEKTIQETIKQGAARPRGIVAVNMFGQPADFQEINELAKKYDLFVLEDSAQSFGSTYNTKKSCSLADIAATSFYPAKPLGCYGDGGMIFLNNADIYENLLAIREHGHKKNKYNHVRLGINGRLDTIQAAVLLAKMELLDNELRERQKIAERYNHELKGTVETPYVKQQNTSAWAQFSIMHPRRDELQSALEKEGISTAIYYPKPLHLQEAFSYLKYKKGDLPVSEAVSEKILSIPMHPYLAAGDQNKVLAKIKKITASLS